MSNFDILFTPTGVPYHNIGSECSQSDAYIGPRDQFVMMRHFSCIPLQKWPSIPGHDSI